jgi:hypothetical protein
MLSVVRTHGGTTERTLCKPYKQTYVGPTNVRYFLEYPLVNTWTYEPAFGLLGKNHRMYASLAERLLLSSPINTYLPLHVLHSFQMPLGCQSVLRVF